MDSPASTNAGFESLGGALSSPVPPSSSEKENAYHLDGKRGRRHRFGGVQPMNLQRPFGTVRDRQRALSLSDDDFASSSVALLAHGNGQGTGGKRGGHKESGSLLEIGSAGIRKAAKGVSNRSISCQIPADTADVAGAEAPAFLAEKRLRSRRSEGWLRKASRPRRLSGPPPRTASDGTSKYVEHLESQVVSLQTQLQSFTSPAAIHSQASKLRIITAENRALQQDLAAWEQEFDERMEEQTQQHALIANSLKAQVRNLENERRRGHELQQELALELEQKLKEIEVLEEAKADLERRLDFMSEIMAKSSPGNLNLYSDPNGGGTVQAKRRPASYVQPRSTPDFANDQQQLPRRWPSRRESGLSPTRAGPIHHRWRPSIDTSVSGQTEPDSDHSESTLVESHDWRPRGRGESFTLQRISTDLSQRAPNRKMRKFHSGSTGPRSLILAPSSPSQESPLSAALSTTSLLWESSDRGSYTPSTGNLSAPFSHSPEHSPKHRFANESLLCSMDEVLKSESAPLSAVTSSASPFYLEPPSGLGQNLRVIESDSSLQPETPQSIGTESGDDETIIAPSPGHPAAGTTTNEHDKQTVKTTHTNQMSLVSRIMTRLSTNLDTHAAPARHVFEHTWQATRPILMRPVVEFRWWLVQILLGDMSRKRSMWLRRQLIEGRPRTPPRLLLSSISGAERAIGLGMTIAEPPPYSPPDTATVFQRPSALERRRRTVPQAPPMTWLKFSMTLLVAVGLAIKDGPASLFAPAD